MTKAATESSAFEEIDREEQERNRQFLKSWKVAVKKIGAELFDVTSASVDAATHKDELCPDLKAIEQYVKTRYDNHHFFLFMVISFYSFLKIEEIFIHAGIGFPRIIDLQFLDETERMIVYSLIENSDIEW